MRPPGASMTNDAHSDMLRSDTLRADQCRVATSVTATPARRSHPIVPVVGFSGDCRIAIAHDGVIAERRDDARAMRGGEPRQCLDIQMIVVCVRYQDDIDRRQVGEGDARIVHAFRPGETERRRALRPYRVEQHIETGGLNEPACVADIGHAPAGAFDARRRAIGKRRRRPSRPLRPRAAPIAIGHPAQQIPPAARRRAVAVEKALAVEVVGNRAGVIS